MRIDRVRLYALALPLRHRVKTGFGEIGDRSGHLVELVDGEGHRGWGEALPLPAFGGESARACAATLQRGVPMLLGRSLDAPSVGERALGPLERHPVAHAAFEMARLDLLSRRQGVPPATLLGGRRPLDALPVNALLRAPTLEQLEEEAAAAVSAGFRSLKLKVAARPLEEDLERVAAVRRAAPTPVALRLDANGGWSEAEASRAIAALSAFSLEWLEQPIPPEDRAALVRLRGEGQDHGLALAADESIRSESDVAALIDAGAVDVVVIKLPVVGGPWRARAIATAAQRRGVRVAITSFIDSTLGIAAAAHVAAALPEVPAPCGLATAGLLEEDLAAPWRIGEGRLCFPVAAPPPHGDAGGFGVTPRLEGVCSLLLDTSARD